MLGGYRWNQVFLQLVQPVILFASAFLAVGYFQCPDEKYDFDPAIVEENSRIWTVQMTKFVTDAAEPK